MVIHTASECKVAARAMGKRWGGTIYKEGSQRLGAVKGAWPKHASIRSISFFGDNPNRALWGTMPTLPTKFCLVCIVLQVL